MSVAVIPMAEELGWSNTDRGIVSSAFFWGYSLTQIPAGYISTKWVPTFTLPPIFASIPGRCCSLACLHSHHSSYHCR